MDPTSTLSMGTPRPLIPAIPDSSPHLSQPGPHRDTEVVTCDSIASRHSSVTNRCQYLVYGNLQAALAYSTGLVCSAS